MFGSLKKLFGGEEKEIQEAGADALEINILALQSDVQYTYASGRKALKMWCAI